MANNDEDWTWSDTAFCIGCCPVIFVWSLHDLYQYFRHYLKPLKPLPIARERALSTGNLALSEPAKSFFSRKSKKEPCLFLDRLPPEVRRMIYAEVLGNHLFRIERRKKSLGHINCQHQVDEACRSVETWLGPPDQVCAMYGAIGGKRWPPRKDRKLLATDPDRNLLALSKTCRKIYSESIDVLYSQNTFNITAWLTLLGFSATLLSQRFRSIKRIHIKLLACDPGNLGPLMANGEQDGTKHIAAAVWAAIWGQVSQCQGLEELKIIIDGPEGDGPKSIEEERKYLEPLTKIRCKGSFEVLVCWQLKGNYSSAPFNIEKGPTYSELYGARSD